MLCRVTFFSIVREQCQAHFKQSIDKVLGHLSKSGKVVDDDVRSLFFGDYINSENKVYDEITDFKELTSVMEQYAYLSFFCMHRCPSKKFIFDNILF